MKFWRLEMGRKATDGQVISVANDRAGALQLMQCLQQEKKKKRKKEKEEVNGKWPAGTNEKKNVRFATVFRGAFEGLWRRKLAC